ncbi:MAG: cell wall hydrolase [Parcubacteria group bacterium]|jgi:hypothetical protein
MEQIKKEKLNLTLKENYNYHFEVPEDGAYFIEIIASAKSWWQNTRGLKSFFRDDDLAVKIDGMEFPKLNGKKGLFDGEAAWNGNNLKGSSKSNFFIINLNQGNHTLEFLAEKNPILERVAIFKIDGAEINYIPENNSAQDGNRRQWITVIPASIGLKKLNIKASAKVYPESRDEDDLKIIIDGEIQQNETNKSHKNWYWCGRVLRGEEKEFNQQLNWEGGLHYIELWADRMPALVSLNLILDTPGDLEKRIPTVDEPEWTGDFNDDTEQMILARAIFGEARSLSNQGKIAVGWCIKNRVNDTRWGNTYHEVILEKTQFSAFNESDKNYDFVKNPLIDEGQKNAWLECYEIADKIVENAVSDPTNGANHYFSDYIEPPYWTKASNAEFMIKIGNTLFYELKKSGRSGFINIKKLFALSMALLVLFLGLLYIAIKINNKFDCSEKLSGTWENESYKHFFLNPKSGEVEVVYFNKDGKFLKTKQVTSDGYPKSQLDVFQDSELVGYLWYLPDPEKQNGKITIIMVKKDEYSDPLEIYRTEKSVLSWEWLDKKHIDIFFNCGTGCQNYHRINIDTKDTENKGTIYSEVAGSAI